MATRQMSVCASEQLEKAQCILDGRWKTLIIFPLFSAATMRFSDLRRAIPAVSEKMLIQQLRDLEKNGVVTREVYPEVRPKVEYSLTKHGRAFRPAPKALHDWAIKTSR
jgi:DNA-binding HxlR family transcriptional regulator